MTDKVYDSDFFQKQFPKALEYALHIINDTCKFIDFAVALTDYMGEDFIPYCKMVYNVFRNLPDFDARKLDDYDTVSNFSLEYIKQKFYDYQKMDLERLRGLFNGKLWITCVITCPFMVYILMIIF